MNYQELRQYLESDAPDEILKKITVSDDVSAEKQRYLKLLTDAYEMYGDGDYHFISSPGRTEIGGNHTDHQHGHVLAASLNIDNVAVVKKNDCNTVRYKDYDFSIKPVDLNDLDKDEKEINSSEALIRGIAARFKELGYAIGGFDALCESRVLLGSGISSSACFEVMISEIFNALYNEDSISPVERAKIGQYSENVYFGKPSGLLDQMTIAVGGFVAIDFKDIEKPVIESHGLSFADHGYKLYLVDTKGDHSDLSHEYAAIPNEIKLVSHELGVEYLADSSLDRLLENFREIREKVNNDRALLRSIHFYNEDVRAIEEKEAVRNGNIDALLVLMKESGRSSFEYLQNVYPASRPGSQSLAIGLSLADMLLKSEGAYRVHGGGFEGTIQVVVPEDKEEEFRRLFESVFGDGCLLEAKVRPCGTTCVI